MGEHKDPPPGGPSTDVVLTQFLIRIAEELLGLTRTRVRGRRTRLTWSEHVGVAFRRVLGAVLVVLMCLGWLLRSATVRLGLRKGR